MATTQRILLEPPPRAPDISQPRPVTITQRRYDIVKWILGMVITGAVPWTNVVASPWDKLTPPQRVIAVNIGAAASIMAWGFNHWDYGNQRAHAKREHWFSRSTKHGGADKLGHTYTSYALASGLRELYLGWGYDKNDSNRQAALSSFLLTGLMEIGDAFSRYGFSYEDIVMNTAGSALSYWFGQHEAISRKISFRVEYSAITSADIFTDYERMKFLAVIKPAGFGWQGVWKYTEFNAGYYTRGYDDDIETPNKRVLFIGLGVNLSQLLNQFGQQKAATILDFVQVPGSYAAIENEYVER